MTKRIGHQDWPTAMFLALILIFSVWVMPSGPRPSQSTGQWITFGHDLQRSGWASDEHTFTIQNVTQLGLIWKAMLPNEPRHLNGLTAPLIVSGVTTNEGVRTLVIVAGSSDHLFALDAETGQLIWKTDVTASTKPAKEGDWLCPNALNATPVIDTARGRVFAVASDGLLHTLALRDGQPLHPPLRFVPRFSKMWSLNYVDKILYTTVGQGCGGAPSGVYAIDPDAPGHPVTAFLSAPNCSAPSCGAGVWGRGGAAVDFSGFIYGATGDGKTDPAPNGYGSSVVKLEPRTLRLADYYTPPNWAYLNKLDLDMGNTTPIVFRWHSRTLAATGGKEGTIFIMDAQTLGGADHHSTVYVSPRISNDEQTFQKNGIWGSLSTWTDRNGMVWLYVPTWGPPATNAPRFPLNYGAAPDGSVMAFKVVADRSGKPMLQAAWMSRDMAVPEPVAIAGGVVFALASGENTEQVYEGDIHRLIKDRTPLMQNNAILYALEAETGRELWNSGTTITEWAHFSGLAVGGGKVFAVTRQGGLYAFGLNPSRAASRFITIPRTEPTTPSPLPTEAAGPSNTTPPADGLGCEGATELFQRKCAMCHNPNGKGSESTHTPDFTDPRWQASRSDGALIEAIRQGKEGEGRMPAFEKSLTTQEIGLLVRCIVRGFAPRRGIGEPTRPP